MQRPVHISEELCVIIIYSLRFLELSIQILKSENLKVSLVYFNSSRNRHHLSNTPDRTAQSSPLLPATLSPNLSPGDSLYGY